MPTTHRQEFRVHGKVVVRESGAPVANLLVSVFDADPATPIDLSHGVAGLSQADVDAWSQVRDALGTAITTDSGSFGLTFEQAMFADQEGELRPDLRLAVFAPAESREGQVNASSRLDRLLLLVDAPGFRAGRSEGFAIRLAEAQLLESGLLGSRTVPAQPDPRQIIDAEIEALKLQSSRRLGGSDRCTVPMARQEHRQIER